MGIFTNLSFTPFWRNWNANPAPADFSGTRTGRTPTTPCESDWPADGAQLYGRAQSLRAPEIQAGPSKKQLFGDVILAVINASNRLPTQPYRARQMRSVPAMALDQVPQVMTATGPEPVSFAMANARIGTAPVSGGHQETPQWQRQYRQTLSLLAQAGYLHHEDADTDFSIRVVIAAIDYISRDAARDDSPHQVALARSLMQDQQQGNDSPQQALTAAQRQDLIRSWITRHLFGARIEDLLVTHLATLPPTTSFRTGDLRTWLHRRCHQQLDKGNSELAPLPNEVHVSRWIWDHVVTHALPLLRYSRHDPVMSVALSDPEWGQQHAGLLLARLAGLDADTVPAKQALALGKMLQTELSVHADLSDWKALFLLPARCSQALTRASKGQASEHAIIANYFADYEKVLRQKCPISDFKQKLDAFQTRPQIAQDIIQRRCPDLPLDTLLEQGAGRCSNSFHTRYDDPTEKFKKEVAALSQAFGRLDKLMLAGAWSVLDADEVSFINRASIRLVKSEVIEQQLLLSPPLVLQLLFPVLMLEQLLLKLHGIDELKTAWLDHLARMEIIMAQAGQEIRFYEMNRSGSQYAVTRRATHQVGDRDSSKAINLTKLIEIFLLDSVLINDGKGTMLHNLLDLLVEQHQSDFYQQMESFGYHKTTLESIEEFSLSLIPFYTCITEARHGNIPSAVFACSIDVLMLIPVFGEMAALSARIGEAYMQGARIAIAAASEMAARNTIQKILQDSAAEFIQHGLRPAADIIGKEEIKSLGVTMLRAVDPGIELSLTLSRAGLRQIIDLGKYLTRYTPELDKILPRLTQQLTPQSDHIAILRDLEKNGWTALNDAGSLGLLAQKLGVELSWLDEHLQLTGTLTDRAKRVLEQADAANIVVGEPLTSLEIKFSSPGEQSLLVGNPPVDTDAGAASSSHDIADEGKIIGDLLALMEQRGISATQALVILYQADSANIGLGRYFSDNDINSEGQRLVDSLMADLSQRQALPTPFVPMTAEVIRQWRQFLYTTDELDRNSMRQFSSEQHIDMAELASYVAADGAVSNKGLVLLASAEQRTIAKFPTPELINDWNASLTKNAIQASALADKHQVNAADFILQMPVILQLSEHGVPLLSASAPQPLTNAKVVIEHENEFRHLPLTRTSSKKRGQVKKLSPWQPYLSDPKSADLRLSLSYSSQSLRTIKQPMARCCQEHLLVWANIGQDQRDHWTLTGFKEYFQINDLRWEDSAKINGHLGVYWSGFGKGWLEGKGTPFTPALLAEMQVDYLRLPGGPQDAPNFARQRKLTPEFLYRTLNPDGTLTLFGKRLKALFKMSTDEARLTRLEKYKTSAIHLRKGMPKRGMLPLPDIQHELAWHQLDDPLRMQWTRKGFSIYFEISRPTWYTKVTETGSLTNTNSAFVDAWEKGDITRMSVAKLVELQTAFKNTADVQNLNLILFAENNQIDLNFLSRLLREDGSLTHSGSEFIRIFEEAAAGPPWEISILNDEDIPDPEWPELQRRAGKTAPHGIATAAILPATVAAPALPLWPGDNAQAPAAPGPALLAAESDQPLADPSGKRIKLDPEPIAERAYHRTDNTWPVLQDPADRTISLVHEQGIIEAIEVTQWYEMSEVFDQLPKNEAQKMRRQITREIKDWLKLGDNYGEKMDELLLVYEDLSTQTSVGQTVAAKVNLKQFQVLGPYAGALHQRDCASLRTASRRHGAGRILSYLWNTPAGGAIDGYQRGNTLSLVNTNMIQTIDGRSVIAEKNNVAAVGVGEHYIFYVAKEDIAQGCQLLVNYGSNYDPHQLIKDEVMPSE